MKEKIPFKHAPWTLYIKLANKLDPDTGIDGNNWRMLAEKLGYATQEILAFEYQQASHGRNTAKVLQDYTQRQGSTVNEVIEALKEIDRPDALREVEESMQEIEKSYHDDLERSRQLQEGQEHEYRCNSCEGPPSYNSVGYQHKLMIPISKYHYSNGMPITHPQDHLRAKDFHRQRSAPPPQAHMGAPIHRIEHDLMGPEYKRQRSVPLSDSMAVRGHDGHSQYFHDMEAMDHSQTIHDDPVPPALGIMRGIQRFDRHAGPSMMESVTTDKKIDTAIFRPPYSVTNHTDRQHPNLKLEIPSKADILRHIGGPDMENFYSPSPTPTTPNTTPLHSLAQMAEGKKYHPDEAYQDLIRMKSQEEMLQNKINSTHMDERGYTVKHEMATDLNAHPSIDIDKLKTKSEEYNPNGTRSHSGDFTKEAPSTYPLRMKSNSCSSSTSPVSTSPLGLMKSASVPNNMKPSEYRKTFRHIKVFVTYSADEKRHTQRVLNLCKCLEKNGFNCCVDIYQRKLQTEDRVGWCQKRFEEADFILVIISPKYRRDVQTCDTDNDADDSDSMDSDDNRQQENPHQLHTKQIYRLMYREYLQNGSRGTRFIPLLFQGMTRDYIPDWLVSPYNPLVYVWPKQYKDLLWMLTKPEKRIPVTSRNVPDRSDSQDTTDSNDIDIESEEL